MAKAMMPLRPPPPTLGQHELAIIRAGHLFLTRNVRRQTVDCERENGGGGTGGEFKIIEL
jgi:hypothetical protein